MNEFDQAATGEIEAGEAGLDGGGFVVVDIDHGGVRAAVLMEDGVDFVVPDREGNHAVHERRSIQRPSQPFKYARINSGKSSLYPPSRTLKAGMSSLRIDSPSQWKSSASSVS